MLLILDKFSLEFINIVYTIEWFDSHLDAIFKTFYIMVNFSMRDAFVYQTKLCHRLSSTNSGTTVGGLLIVVVYENAICFFF